MKFTAISLIVSILFISSVSAFIFDIESPESVNVGQSFIVSIDYDTTQIYDVKIFINDSGDNIISDIYNGDEWRSSYYYIKASYPERKDYDIIVPIVANKDLSGTYDICARLRRTNQTGFSDSCSKITVNLSPGSSNDQQDEEEAEDDNDNENDEENESAEEETDEKAQDNTIQYRQIADNNTYNSDSSPNDYSDEKIVLNSKNDSQTSDLYISKQEKTRNWIVYSLLGISVFIIIFLALRKL